jgi:hypothetical protein
MGELSSEHQKTLSKTFGIPTEWFAVPIAIAVSASLATTHWTELASPLFRWIAFGIVVLLCLCAIAFGKKSSRRIGFQDPNAPPEKQPPRLWIWCVLAMAGVWLSIDLYVNFASFRSPVEVVSPSFVYQDANQVAVEPAVYKKLDSYKVKGIGYTTPVLKRLPLWAPRDRFGATDVLLFKIRKKDAYSEVILDDIYLEVTNWEPYEPFKQKEVAYPTAFHGVEPIEAFNVYFQIPSDIKQFPRKVSPSFYYTDEKGWAKWEKGKLSLRQPYQLMVKMYVSAAAGGICTFRPTLRVTHGLGSDREISVTAEPISFWFIAVEEGQTLKLAEGLDPEKPYFDATKIKDAELNPFQPRPTLIAPAQPATPPHQPVARPTPEPAKANKH